jgi:predicted DNA-binding transcriptional regulator AlpA
MLWNHSQTDGGYSTISTLLRFRDLKSKNIVRNWPTLLRLIERNGFPAGIQLGGNSRAWREEDVEAWLVSRSIDPPDIAKPGPAASTAEAGPITALVGTKSKSTLTAEPVDTQLFNGDA